MPTLSSNIGRSWTHVTVAFREVCCERQLSAEWVAGVGPAVDPLLLFVVKAVNANNAAFAEALQFRPMPALDPKAKLTGNVSVRRKQSLKRRVPWQVEQQ